MRINAFFISYDGTELQLLDAWDEYTIDSNPDGYAEARAQAAKDPDHQAFAEVELEVSEALIRTALFPQTVVVVAEVVSDVD